MQQPDSTQKNVGLGRKAREEQGRTIERIEEKERKKGKIRSDEPYLGCEGQRRRQQMPTREESRMEGENNKRRGFQTGN